MNKNTKWIGIAIALAWSHLAIGQAVISVNFYNNGSYQLSGNTGHVDVSNWNNFLTDNSATPKTVNSLLDANTLNSGASITVDSQAGWQANVSTATQGSTMESSYWDTGGGGSGTDGQITISNLPAALTANGYFVILYMRGTDSMGANTAAEFGARVGGEEYWLRWIRNTVDGSFTQSAYSTEPSAQSGGKDNNMLILSNGGDFYSSSSLTIDVLKDPDSTAGWARAAVTGLQIVPAPNSESISVNFYESNTYTVTGTAGQSPATNWNNFKTDNSATPKILSLFDGNGDVSAAWIGVDSQAGWQANVSTASQSSTMESSYWDTGGGGFGTDGQITINNMPLAMKQRGYYVILHMRGTDTMGANTAAEFGARVGGEEYWLRWIRNTVDGSFTQSVYATEPSAQSGGKDNNMLILSNGGDFFTSSSLTIDVLKDPDSTAGWARAAVTGLQIVAAPSSESISVNFHESDTYTVTGTAGQNPAANWNNFKIDNSATPKTLSLFDGNGDVSGAWIGVDSQAAWQANVSTASQNSTMESSYWDTGGGGFGTDGQITINNMPLAMKQRGYYVILHMRGTDGMGAGTPAEFGARIGAEEYWLRWIRNTVDGSFSQSTYTSEPIAQSSGSDDNVLILNNSGDYYFGSSLTIDVLKDPDNAAAWARAAVTGVQILGRPSATVLRFR